MSLQATSELQEKRERPLSLRLTLRVFKVLGPYRWLVFLGNLLLAACLYADMAIIEAIKGVVNRDDLLATPVLTAIGPLLLMCFLERLFGLSQYYITLYATNRAMAVLRTRFFRKLMQLNKAFYDRHKSGWLVARSTGDLGVLHDFMTYALMMIVAFVSAMGLALYRISRISPILLVPALATIPVVACAKSWYNRRMSRVQRDAREQNSRLVAKLSETLRGIRVVQAFSREKDNLDDFNEINLLNHDTEIKAARLNALFLPAMDFIGILNTTAVVAFGAWLVANPDLPLLSKPLTTGDLVAYLLYMNMIIWPVRMMVEFYGMALRAMAAGERIFEVMDMEPTVRDGPDAVPARELRGEIDFQNVHFRYGEQLPEVIRGVTFHVSPGQTIALVGATGAGKTTISALLARFYDVTAGCIRIDGRDVREYQLDSLHQQMGIVLQEGFLFTGTVMDNLRFRNPDMPREAVIAMARELGTDHIIRQLANGYDTEILEGGQSLSEGQRQLLAITRALVADPRILILDEPTSALDVYTESLLRKAIVQVSRHRTTLIIAHRLSTVRHADRILLVDGGRIVESGTHDELVSLDGLYARLVRRSESSDRLEQ